MSNNYEVGPGLISGVVFCDCPKGQEVVQRLSGERAAASALQVAEATHVRPKRVVINGTIIGTAVIGVFSLAVLWMQHEWSTPWQVSLAAIVAVGVPFGLTAAKVLPKLFGDMTGGN